MFKVEGLRDVEVDLKVLHIPLYVHVHEAENIDSFIVALEKLKPHTIVTDFSPLRIQQRWLHQIKNEIKANVYEVDTHNIIPVWITSSKLEYAAYTIRPKIHKLIEQFLVDFPKVKKMPIENYVDIDTTVDNVLDTTLDEIKEYTKVYVGGGVHAKKRWKNFLEHDLQSYDTKRNNPLLDGQSGMSPYLHYGQISSQRMVLDVCEKAGKGITSIIDSQKNGSSEASSDPFAAYLEELVVRKELSDNYCYYQPKYDSIEAFSVWATNSLAKHEKYERAFIYTQKQFEQAQTHDMLWNAAQQEMLQTGKMHGYMRMYWAKKILEWTKNSKDAMAIAIYLNDRYELDGRDPSGYAGIAWSIGGVHDRAWFERPIFGMVRYMARSGVEKRCKVNEYIKKWLKDDTGSLF